LVQVIEDPVDEQVSYGAIAVCVHGQAAINHCEGHVCSEAVVVIVGEIPVAIHVKRAEQGVGTSALPRSCYHEAPIDYHEIGLIPAGIGLG
jgi:hypothetical protein